MAESILIIGGVAAGLSAASRARRLSPRARITVLERGPVASYGACGLPYFLAGEIASLHRLIAHSVDFFRQHRQIDVLTGHEAVEIEPGRRRVRVRAGGAEQWHGYDRLVIATGARARWQPQAGHSDAVRLRNVFTPTTWSGAQALDEALRGDEIRRVVVVGGGYIGLEMADALARRNRPRRLEVTLIAAGPSLLRGFDAEMAQALPARVASAGIVLRQPERVEALEGAPGGRVLGVRTGSGRLDCDAVVNCGGLRPETALASDCGVALGPTTGAIAVDERQQTNLNGVYAAGDCAETRQIVSGAPVWIPLGAAANKQGRIAGENAAGGRARFPGVLGTLALSAFGYEWGRTGLSLEQAQAAGFDAEAQYVESSSRAGYLDPQPVAIKLIYDRRSQRLLGCHLRGAPGTVAGRLDTAAVALTAGMRLEEVEMLDLVYAPDLAPLYEPLHIAAHLARQRL